MPYLATGAGDAYDPAAGATFRGPYGDSSGARSCRCRRGRAVAELREEAIAALCLPDLEVVKEWDGYPIGSGAFAIDAAFERYARADEKGNVSASAELLTMCNYSICPEKARPVRIATADWSSARMWSIPPRGVAGAKPASSLVYRC